MPGLHGQLRQHGGSLVPPRGAGAVAAGAGVRDRAEAAPLWAVEELAILARGADPAAAADAARTLTPVWPGAVRAYPRPGELLAGALAAAVAVDDAGVAAALLSPFTIESVGGQHAEALADVRRSYGDPWLDDLLGQWFGDPRHTSWPGSGLSRQQWLLTLPDCATTCVPSACRVRPWHGTWCGRRRRRC